MSDLGGLALSRVSGDGTQRLVKGDLGVSPDLVIGLEETRPLSTQRVHKLESMPMWL